MTKVKLFLAIAAAAVALSGCAVQGAIGGNTADCVSAQSQLNTLQTALSAAQLALSTAQALGAPVAVFQAAVTQISGDVDKVAGLVNSECAAPTLTARVEAPTITLAQAKKLAAADKALAAALKSRN